MNKRGLTLIELISSCAIVSLLMAIFLPALGASRQKAKTIICAANIRQLQTATAVYALHYNRFPYGFADSNIEPFGGFPGSLSYNKKGWWWFNYVGRFHNKKDDNENILECPSKQAQNESVKRNILCGNYGVNQSICKAASVNSRTTEFTGPPLMPGEVSNPSETLLIVDAGYALINWWHVTLEPPRALNPTFIENTSYIPGMNINSEKTIWQGLENDAVLGRHQNKTVNIGFVDGHVKREDADECLIKKTQKELVYKTSLWSPK